LADRQQPVLTSLFKQPSGFCSAFFFNNTYLRSETVKRPTEQEFLMTIQMTPNEVIAANVAIAFYLKNCQPIFPGDKETRLLLDQYLRRLLQTRAGDEQTLGASPRSLASS
jgi:hypothetical protein